ncbi:MAG: alkaline phosphatase [Leptothrix sp. (in: b-proteobacteria)]
MRIASTLAGCLLLSTFSLAAHAGALYPIDRASVLAGARFDLKVEFDASSPESALQVRLNGKPVAAQLGKSAQYIANENGKAGSTLIWRDVSLATPGSYRLEASDGKETLAVNWEVYATGPRKARNVIFFVGDGMTLANRTAARMLSKGIKEGKYFGKLAFDDMPHMALVGTSGVDSIITDSANSMSAYTTGHKSSVNALGVYASRAAGNLDHPKVETLTEVVKRTTKMSVGIVSDAEIEDATPAGMVAHTRRRGDKDVIAEQLFLSQADVILGGGSAWFLSKNVPGSKRKDDNDLFYSFRAANFRIASTDRELKAAAADPKTTQLLGLFHLDNMDGALDRHFLKKGTVDKFPEQPDLTDMTRSAIEVLSRNPDGFVLMVEAGLIDKYNHPLDWERSVYDTIMLSNAVQVAKDFAAKHPDTLIIVTPDHTHGMSIVGTVDDSKPGTDMREKVGVYEEAGYPNYPQANAAGYPERVDVSKRLAIFYGNTPDYYETFQPKLDGVFVPAVKDGDNMIANPAYKDVPGAQLRTGILPRQGKRAADQGTHTADDGLVSAMGPGSERFAGFIDNTEVFRNIVDALGLAAPATPAKAPIKVSGKVVSKAQP